MRQALGVPGAEREPAMNLPLRVAERPRSSGREPMVVPFLDPVVGRLRQDDIELQDLPAVLLLVVD
jgi:hypothetical protein